MNRLYLVIVMVMLSGFLSAYFTPYENLTNSNEKTGFDAKSGTCFRGTTTYVCYTKFSTADNFSRLLYLEKFRNDGTREIIEVDSYANAEGLTAPVLNVTSNGNVFIFYTKKNGVNDKFIVCVAKITPSNAISFPGSVEDYISDVQITRSEDKTNLYFNNRIFRQLCYYMYYTDSEVLNLFNNANDGNFYHKFSGNDVMQGRVHSNSDIYLMDNGGWPTFYEAVTTSGTLRHINGAQIFPNPPPGFEVNEVFQDGFLTNVPRVEIHNESSEVVYYYPFGQNPSANIDIIKVEIQGSQAIFQTGDITSPFSKCFKVYDSFPDALHPDTPIGDSLCVNFLSVVDTIWTNPIPMNIPTNSIIYIPATLWIKGQISGKQVWQSRESTYITGDITYSGTEPGQNPNANTTDYFGLISEMSIFLKYKYRMNSEPISYANSQGPDGDIYLYGAYAALGKGSTTDPNGWREDGVFSFEYQHPHGSVPDFRGISPFTGADTVFTNIDLHKYRFPPTNGTEYWQHWPYTADNGTPTSYPYASLTDYPWYGSTDWPWYNPVWPEKRPLDINNPDPATEIVYERGTVHMFGSLAQMKKGLLYRTGQVDALNPDLGSWGNYQYGPAHPPTGYQFDFKYDPRLENSPLPYFPGVMQTNCTYYHRTVNANGIQTVIDSLASVKDYKDFICSKSGDLEVLLSMHYDSDSLYFSVSNDGGLVFNDHVESYLNTNIPQTNKIHDFQVWGNSGYILYSEFDNPSLYILKVDFSNFNMNLILVQASDYEHQDLMEGKFFVSNTGKLLLTFGSSIMRIYENNVCSVIAILPETQIVNKRVNLSFDESDSVYVFISGIDYEQGTANPDYNALLFCRGDLGGITPNADNQVTPVLPLSMVNYPNPFNPTTMIEMNIPSAGMTSLEIYNCRGQKVKTLVNTNLGSGIHKVVFEGKNDQGNVLSSGVYFSVLKSCGQTTKRKMLLIK